MTTLYNVDPEQDSARYNPDVHYRLYHPTGQGPTTICVQDHDYPDYLRGGFITYDSYPCEEDAENALDALKVRAMKLLRLPPFADRSGDPDATEEELAGAMRLLGYLPR